MNANRDKGIRAERAVVAYLKAHGHPHARRALAGPAGDVGDIEGTRAVWEVRDRGQVRLPSWLAGLDAKTVRAGVPAGLLVLKMPGLGAPHAGLWPVAMRPGTWGRLTRMLPPAYASVIDVDARGGLDLEDVMVRAMDRRTEMCAWIGAARVSLRSGLVVHMTTLEAAASLVPPVTSQDDMTKGERS
ncbi:hypothetical protein [Catellatospora sp. NPDC049609]|uniref:hypothetical protein n=1 Tax=Catellatospora sp. NPDC049609 TaxID=3155505 RepID=UPI00343309EF